MIAEPPPAPLIRFSTKEQPVTFKLPPNIVRPPPNKPALLLANAVFVMVALASIFFFAADQIIRYLVTFLLGIH